MLPRRARICDSRGRRLLSLAPSGRLCVFALKAFCWVVFTQRRGEILEAAKEILIEKQVQVFKPCAIRIFSTYFAITSTSRFTSSPGCKCEKFVTSHVFGITAMSK